MHGEFVLPAEPLAASAAAEGLLAGVETPMARKVRRVSKAQRAEIAAVRALAGMTSTVLVMVAQVGEGFSAEAADRTRFDSERVCRAGGGVWRLRRGTDAVGVDGGRRKCGGGFSGKREKIWGLNVVV